MWAEPVTLVPHRVLPSRDRVDMLWGVGTGTRFPHGVPDRPHCVRSRGDYSADNSWRACSTRSRNVRSRDIWRLTLSTLWITVE
jgi:hypothetical protein